MIPKNYLQIITEQKVECERLKYQNWIKRPEEELFEFETDMAQIVIGVRRSGKSTLCHRTLKSRGIRYAFLNFDDERLTDVDKNDLNTLLEGLYTVYGSFDTLFLDEVQNIEGWQLFVNRLLRMGKHLFVTGSNAKLLSSELSTHLTGRYNRIELFPFSFSEYCRYTQTATDDITTEGQGLLKRAFNEYMQMGGLPELLRLRNKRGYVNNLFDSILNKDILERYKVKYVAVMMQLANHLLNNSCQELNYKSLVRTFGIKSIHTVENYVDYMRRTYLLVGIHKFSFKSRLRIRNEKIYAIDNAFITMRADAMMGDNTGWRLENMVCIELLRRIRPQWLDLYYFKTSYEVDFVVCNGNTPIHLYQVTVSMDDAKTRRREVGGLLKGAKDLQCERMTIITLSEKKTICEDGHTIEVVPIIEWLLLAHPSL